MGGKGDDSAVDHAAGGGGNRWAAALPDVPCRGGEHVACSAHCALL